MNILPLLQCLEPSLTKTNIRRLSQIVLAMLSMTGRVTMLGISRWTESGGSYRTVQRFFYTQAIPWAQIYWLFFRQHLLCADDIYVLAGDEVVVTKAGKQTHGLDRFFAGLYQKVVPGVSFFTLSLISIKQRCAYPLRLEQVVRSEAEKAARKAKKATKQSKPSGQKGKAGRPKGSHNKNKAAVELSPELQRIQQMLHKQLRQMAGLIPLTYLALDGHFGNHLACRMVQQCGLHLISKLRSDTALYFRYTGAYAGHGRPRRYGDKLDYRHLPEAHLKQVNVEDGIETRIYQAEMLHKEFDQALNVVLLVKRNLKTGTQAHVLLFCSDLSLACDKLIDLYSLRFQIEFNFRDAKQFWGLEDFMNITPTAVTNVANLSLFLVLLSKLCLRHFRASNADFGILDLKAYYRSYRYLSETIKLLPHLPDDNSFADIFRKLLSLGSVHLPHPSIFAN
jgi:putative transposase